MAKWQNAQQVQDVATVRPARNDARAYRRWHYLKNRAKVLQQSKDWYLNNKERKLSKASDWAASHPDDIHRHCKKWRDSNKEHERYRNKEYHSANRCSINQKQRDRMRLHYLKNRDSLLAKNREWRQRNKAYILHQAAKRRALKKLSTVNLGMIRGWMAYIKSLPFVRCYYCSEEIRGPEIHFDHIVPLAKGGPHCIENLCVACQHCNCSKRDKSIRAWVKL